MRQRTRLTLWWLGLDKLEKVSVICAVLVIGAALFVLAFLLEIV